MKDQVADFVLVGSTPFALLLAGLLSGKYERHILLISRRTPSFRLPHCIDLSCAPITRPQSWAMLVRGMQETFKLTGQIAGRAAWKHVDPVFFSSAPHAIEALSHMRHMAQAFGVAAEQAPKSLLDAGYHGVIFRDAALLDRLAFQPHLLKWLHKTGVQLIAPEAMSIADDGSAVITNDGVELCARQTMLADDAAILSHLKDAQWPGLLVRHPAATILTAPTRTLAARVMMEIESGLILLKQLEGGIAAIGLESMVSLSGRVQNLLGQTGPIEQLGQTRFIKISTKDGAPAVGRINGTGPDIVAGLGPIALFFVPALARWLCNKASADEADWFGARLVSRRTSDTPVSEYSSSIGSLTA